MITPPFITQSAAQHTAIIHLTIPRDQMQHVMGPGIGEIFATLAAQEIAPAGSWFCQHRKMHPDTFDFEISVPVATPITATGRVQPSQLPATKVARTVMHGGYEGLGEAWGEFMAWMDAEGLKQGENLWECYTIGPESGPDSALWRTELNRPLIG